jgi:hypothetical protein
MIDDSRWDSRQACYVAVLWMAIAGAAIVNQRVLLEHVSGEKAAALSVLLWVGEAICVAVLIYLLADHRLAEQRVSMMLSTWFPLMLPLWLTVIAVFYLKVLHASCIPPVLMLTTVPLLMWRARPSALVSLVAILVAALGFVALFWPAAGIWCVIASCACLLVPAMVRRGPNGGQQYE